MKTNPLEVLQRRNLARALAYCSALGGLASALSTDAASLHLNFAPPTSFNESNRQAILEWDAEPGKSYLIQSADEIAPATEWRNEDVAVKRTVGPIRWMAPEALQQKKFYRVSLPQAGVYSIEPTWVNAADPNALLYLIGESLPTNGSVVINGQNYAPAASDSNGTWVAVSLNGLPPGTPITGSALVLDAGSNIVAELAIDRPVLYGNEPSPEQLQSPPQEPPASPQANGYRWWNKRKLAEQMATAKQVTLDGDPLKEESHFMEVTGLDIHPSTGEACWEMTDLAIPGRGLDFVWTRTYRSRNGPTTSLGAGWDFSYNVSLTPQPDGTVLLRSGSGRSDTFYPNGSNGWVRDEWFVEVRDLDGDGFPDVLFADGGKWMFHPDGTPLRGKIAAIVDRNGNTIRCEYDDVTSQLVRVVDTLDRTNTIAYSPAGLIESVTDFSGRTVRYEYDGNGDLTAVISPTVLGTPNKNDFPGGKTNRFTYTSGFADARLNHNLTHSTDALGQSWLQLVYQTNQDSASVDFDAVAAVLRGIEKSDIRRGMVVVKPGGTGPHQPARFAIVNDAVGNVSEYAYDSRHRLLTRRQFTGRADPALPTTETENRPAGKLRPGDPDYFETAFEWNADSLCTRVVYPRGNATELVYERAFNQNASRTNKRHSGDLRVLRQLACCDQDDDGDGLLDELRWRFEYDARFGSPGAPKKASGGKLGSFAKGVAQVGLGVAGGGGVPSGRVDPGMGSGSFGTLLFEDLWPCAGDLDFNDLAVRYATQAIDPRGNVTTCAYDATGNLIRSTGAFIAGNDPPQVDLSYNEHGQLTGITNAADATGFRRVDTFEFYTSGPSLGHIRVQDSDASGGNLVRTTYEYDARGNVTRIIDPRGNAHEFTWNALDQLVQRQTPQTDFGSVLRTQYAYDANDNVVRQDHDNSDAAGAVDAANPQWTTLYGYDLLDRLTTVAIEVAASPVGADYVTHRYGYDGNDNRVLTETPLAVLGDEPDNVTRVEYDERDLPHRIIRAPDTSLALTNTLDYDGNGLLTLSAVPVLGAEPDLNIFRYDGFDRRIEIVDALSNRVSYAYDRNGNLRYERCEGELHDGAGDAANIRLAETTYQYDALNRLRSRADSFFDLTTQAPLGDGHGITTYAYAPNGQFTSVTDDNGHATRYAYDTVGRLASVTDPKLNLTSYAYDPCGNILSVTQTDRSDLGGTAQQFTVVRGFDKLHRLTRSVDSAGNTNLYAYDSRDLLGFHTDPNGNLTGYTYDGLERRTLAIADLDRDGILDLAVDAQTTYQYDDNSRLVSVTDDNGHATTYSYDVRDRCVLTGNPDGTQRTFIWDSRSELVATVDANGTAVTNSFDALHRCIQREVTPGPGVAATTTFEQFEYDGMSRLVLVSNDLSRTEFSYDSLGNCLSQNQDGLTTALNCDAVGNRLATSYPSGRLVTYEYDAADQVRSVSSSSGGPATVLATFDYDGPGRLGRIVRRNGVNTRYQWDGLVNPPNAPGDFGWRQVSGINHQAAGGGVILDRRGATYDRNQNRLSRAQLAPFFAGGSMTTNLFAYDALDRLAGFTRETGSPDDYFRQYQLDGNGNRVSSSFNGLLSIYELDATLPEPADFQMNQYTLTPFVAAPEQYDPNGNLVGRVTADRQLQYAYDFADRLVEVVDLSSGLPALVASYRYDALGRRIRKVVAAGLGAPPVETRFVYDGSAVIEERDGFGIVGKTFVLDGTRSHDDGEIRDFTWTQTSGPFKFSSQSGKLMMSSGGLDYYYHADDLANVVVLCDDKGNVVERYDYDDFGLPRFLGADGFDLGTNTSTVGNPYLFHSLVWDSETDWYHDPAGVQFMDKAQLVDLILKDRKAGFSATVDPATGRYITRTESDNRGNNLNWEFGNNRLAFAGNNPWSHGGTKGQDHNSSRSNKRASAQDHNSSRSNKSASAQDHNSSRSNKTSRNSHAGGGGGGAGGLLDFEKNTENVSGGFSVMFNPREYTVTKLKEEGGRHTPFHNRYRPNSIQDRAEVRVDKFQVRQEFGPTQASRRFQTLSNASKARHETAMNSIRNMK